MSFAGVLMIVVGAFNCIDGVAAVGNANYFENVANGGGDLPLTDEIQAWGWVVLALGAVMIATGIGLMSRQTWARMVGVALVGLNLLVQFAYIPHYPFWSLTMIFLDVVVIYGLVAYGERTGQRA